MKTKREDILKWFTGKARENAEHALNLLIQSEKEGEWIPKASRSVRAALGKHNVATKIARGFLDDGYTKVEDVLGNMRTKSEDRTCSTGRGFDLWLTMAYGTIARLQHIDMDALAKLAKTDQQKEALKRCQPYYAAFIEAAQLMQRLDDTRPKPVFTSIGVSPTITKTLQDASLDLNVSTIRPCPWKYERVQEKDKDGVLRWVTVIVLLWPEDTVFNRSRFAGTGHQCHSCGHAIHNPFNWVPILIDNKKGIPHALWIGRDCASRVFGIKIKGDLRIKGGKQ